MAISTEIAIRDLKYSVLSVEALIGSEVFAISTFPSVYMDHYKPKLFIR